MAHDIGPCLRCDGSWEGLLTALFFAESIRPKASGILLADTVQTDLFEQPIVIATQQDKAQRVLSAIKNKLPSHALWVVESVYVSCLEDRATIIMRYLRLGWQVGAQLNNHLAQEEVITALEICKKVGFEIHRFKGLLRFRPMFTIYYAKFTPDHDIAHLLAPHFADRLGDQKWIMHDIAREKAVLYQPDTKEWVMIPLKAKDDRLEHKQDGYTDLWRAYHRAIAIKERENLGLQRQFMPRRYWENLPEANDML